MKIGETFFNFKERTVASLLSPPPHPRVVVFSPLGRYPPPLPELPVWCFISCFPPHGRVDDLMISLIPPDYIVDVRAPFQTLLSCLAFPRFVDHDVITEEPNC